MLNTAACQMVRKKWPNCKQHMITTALGKTILNEHPALDSVLEFRKRDVSFLSEARRLKSVLKSNGCHKGNTATLLPHRSFRSQLLSQYFGFSSIGYQNLFHSCLYSRKVPRLGILHEAFRIGLLTEPLGFERQEILQARPFLEKATKHPSLPQTGPLIAMSPGSKWGTKMWPISNFSKAARHLLANSSVHLVLLGAPDEKHLAQEIVAANENSSRILNLVGQTKLNELPSIYPYLDLVITNDSSPMHYASAFNRPTLAIFGATTSSMGFGPLSEESVVLENNALDCRPCSVHGPKTCPLGHFKCMKSISSEELAEKCFKMLNI